MKALILIAMALIVSAQDYTRAPDGTWTQGDKQMRAPDRTWVSGDKAVRTPDRTWVGGTQDKVHNPYDKPLIEMKEKKWD